MSGKWCDCKIKVRKAHIPFLENYLSNLEHLTYSVYQKPHSRKSEIRLFFPSKKRKTVLPLLEGALELLKAVSGEKKATDMSVSIRSEEEYRDEWKSFFKTIKIGRFVICPSWIKPKRKKGDSIIDLDPGMAFGTGNHFTTHYCVQMIQEYSSKRRSFLDAGCGSGILSIVASMCGLKSITGIDNSRDAARIARENFEKNCPGQKAVFEKMRLEKFPSREKYDLIAANLYDKIIIPNAKHLSGLLKKGGVMILSGIRYSAMHSVEKAFSRHQILDKGYDKKKEWSGFVFKKCE